MSSVGVCAIQHTFCKRNQNFNFSGILKLFNHKNRITYLFSENVFILLQSSWNQLIEAFKLYNILPYIYSTKRTEKKMIISSENI